MAGFGLEGVFGRIPCPHCGETDCCGMKSINGEDILICCHHDRAITEEQLRAQAKKHKLSLYESESKDVVDGWQLRVATKKGNDAAVKRVGEVHIYNNEKGYIGTADSLDVAKAYMYAVYEKRTTSGFDSWLKAFNKVAA